MAKYAIDIEWKLVYKQWCKLRSSENQDTSYEAFLTFVWAKLYDYLRYWIEGEAEFALFLVNLTPHQWLMYGATPMEDWDTLSDRYPEMFRWGWDLADAVSKPAARKEKE